MHMRSRRRQEIASGRRTLMRSGGNVVDIGTYRFKKVNTRSYGMRTGDCQHRNLTIDLNGEIITCDDCQKQVTAMWAVCMFLDYWDRLMRDLENRRKTVEELESKTVVLKAAKAVERAWRQRSMVPCCPHCHRAIFPTDGFPGRSSVNKQMELARRRRESEGDR